MSRSLRSIATLLLALPVTGVPASVAAQVAPSTRAVLVTGASSGIGRRITERLAAEGFHVYAGARSREDLEALGRIPNVESIRLDVTVPQEIDSAVARITRAGRGLYGVVNNAGVAIIAPLIEVPESEMRFIFDVNVFGPYRVTKAFAPLLLQSKGRVVNISSISGILSGQMLGPYSMTKHAVEAYGDALGAELGRLGVRVSTIEPGNYRSEIGRNVLARVNDPASAGKGSLFETQLQNTLRAMGGYENYPEPHEVAAAALHALSDSAPRARYMVVPAANQAAVTIRKAMEELVQLNEGHPFTMDREALIRLLDETIARVRTAR